MKKIKSCFSLISLVAVFGVSLWGQTGISVLTTEDAAKILLANNYGIILSKNSVQIAENNTSKYNTGKLPAVFTNAGVNYGINASKINYNDDHIPQVSVFGSNALNYNGSIGINYLLLDGKSRQFNIEKFSENLNIANLEVRKSVETALLQMYSLYYDIARLAQNITLLKQSREISSQRLRRAKYQLEYGQSTRLNVLNAEVDFNRDSVNLLNLNRQLTNQKRNLNLLLGRDLDINFDVDTTVAFAKIRLEDILAGIESKNIDLLLLDRDLAVTQLDKKINEAALKPRVSAVGSYAIAGGFNDDKVTIANQLNTGLSAGLSLSWNIFDGGYAKIRDQNIEVAIQSQLVRKDLQLQQIKRDVKNYWEIYQNQLFVMEVEKQNIQTAQLNFENTQNRFKIGQLSSVEFRQAQLNLLNARLSYDKSKYNAKLAELNLLQLAGEL